jgi:hypothetical protein
MKLTKEKKLCGYFTQDNATTLSKIALEEEHGVWLITHGMQPPRTTDLNPPCYYL